MGPAARPVDGAHVPIGITTLKIQSARQTHHVGYPGSAFGCCHGLSTSRRASPPPPCPRIQSRLEACLLPPCLHSLPPSPSTRCSRVPPHPRGQQAPSHLPLQARGRRPHDQNARTHCSRC